MNDLNLRPEDMDRLGQALLTLAQELWVVKDRLRILEAVLVDASMVLPETVDRYQPQEDLAQELAAERAQFINQLLDTLAPETD